MIPFGDLAFRFDIPPDTDRRALLSQLRSQPNVLDVVLTERIGLLVVAPAFSLSSFESPVACRLSPVSSSPSPVLHTIRVAYTGEDLASLAARLSLTVDALIALHTAPTYEVAMLGFLPGFAYLRGLDPRLCVPRREQPRTRVPARSVALAADYTGIYPFASPGGWHLLGEAVDFAAFGPDGATFAIGDRVRFERLDEAPAPRRVPTATLQEPELASAPRGAHLEVRRAAGLILVVDGGRFGHMHEGIPHGGPLVPEALAIANASAGNPASAASLEIFGALEVVARNASVVVADDAGHRSKLGEGKSFTIGTEGRTRVRYLALTGGVNAPLVLGSRGTLLVASMGGLDGRPLRRGDRLTPALTPAPAPAPALAPAPAPAPAPALPPAIAITPGPDHDPLLTHALSTATFTITPTSDRTGLRLSGPPLPANPMHSTHARSSTPMVRGAIELTPTGLIVLGPDHPTTGGYPVVAVVAARALGPLFALPIGSRIRLIMAPRQV